VVLNKSAVVVSKESLPGEAYETAAKGGTGPTSADLKARDDAQAQVDNYLSTLQSHIKAGNTITPTQMQTLQSHSNHLNNMTGVVTMAGTTSTNWQSKLQALYRQHYNINV
jgi:hypothetical protein